MLIRDSSAEIMNVVRTAFRGTSQPYELTLANHEWKGTPLSRENAYSCLEAQATVARLEKMHDHMMSAERPVVAAVDLVEFRKIWMNGYPVGVVSTESTSPMQKHIVMVTGGDGGCQHVAV